MISCKPVRTRAFGLLAILMVAGVSTGCSSLQPKDFAAVKPTFQPERFFEGRVQAWGVIEDSSGNPTKRFTSVDVGQRQGNKVTISQAISFSDGTHQQRSWQLTRIDATHFHGTADDIIGIAEGEADGNTLRLEYTLAPSASNPFTHVHVSQWLYLQDGGDVLISRTTISKLGIVVARIAEYVHRDPVGGAVAH